MPYSIALVTDSTCDIPAEWLQQYEIAVVPLTIIFGDQQFLDGVDMTAEEFYQRLPTEKNHPSTSQPSPQAFLEAYRRAAQNGAQEILVNLEKNEFDVEGRPRLAGENAGEPGARQLSLFADAEARVVSELQRIDPDRMTPMEALQFLSELRKRLT